MSEIKGIEIRTRAGGKESQGGSRFLTLLFLLAGVYGILSCLRSLSGITYMYGAVDLLAALVCLSIVYSFGRHKRLFYGTAVLCGLVLGGLLLFMGRDLIAQLAAIRESLAGSADGGGAVTAAAVFLAIMLCWLLFLFELVIKSHMALYLLTTLLTLMAPLFGLHISMHTLLLLLLFQVCFWVVHTTAYRGMRETSGHREGMDSGQSAAQNRGGRHSRLRLTDRSSLMMGGLAAAAFLLAAPLVAGHAQWFYDEVYRIEGAVSRMLSTINGSSGELSEDGKINRGNLYRTGTIQLQLRMDRKPSETLYLRGFEGGDYLGGEWEQGDDEKLYLRIIDIMAEKGEDVSGGADPYSDIGRIIGDEEWLYSNYNSMYYNANLCMDEAVTQKAGSASDALSLSVRHGSRNYENTYAPYYGSFENDGIYTIYGTGRGGYVYDQEGYRFSYFQQRDMHIDWDAFVDEWESYGTWHKQIEQAYRIAAGETFTAVPYDILPRLTALYRENPLTDPDEISAFILYTLQSNARYSLTPGWAPYNEDMVEYFLFENQQGYCQHFATAATLLYRLYGVPARYVTGYAVSPSDFIETSDGTWIAFATDYHAHAWTEIFLENYGWTPVEVTPSSDGVITTSYPGFDSDEMKTVMQRHDWKSGVPSLDLSRKRTVDGGQDQDVVFPRFSLDLSKQEKPLLVAVTCLALGLLLLPLFLDYRRLRKWKKREEMSGREIFSLFLRMAQEEGVLVGYTGSESDFADRLHAEIPVISGEEAQQFVEMIRAAAFGPGEPGEPEREMALRMYRRTASWLYENMGRRKRFIFRWIRACI